MAHSRRMEKNRGFAYGAKFDIRLFATKNPFICPYSYHNTLFFAFAYIAVVRPALRLIAVAIVARSLVSSCAQGKAGAVKASVF